MLQIEFFTCTLKIHHFCSISTTQIHCLRNPEFPEIFSKPIAKPILLLSFCLTENPTGKGIFYNFAFPREYNGFLGVLEAFGPLSGRDIGRTPDANARDRARPPSGLSRHRHCPSPHKGKITFTHFPFGWDQSIPPSLQHASHHLLVAVCMYVCMYVCHE